MKNEKKFIPLDKMSKKERKAWYAAQRVTWGICDPVTRSAPNGKGYNRKKLADSDRKRGISSDWGRDSSFFIA